MKNISTSFVVDAVILLAIIGIFNYDDNFARYLGQFAAEVVKGFATGGIS